MIDVRGFHDFLIEKGVGLFTGVPDSQLKEFCDFITTLYGTGERHIIAANEGNAVGIAAGYHLATGGIPLVYMQNSGLGNAVNPITSLIDPMVYAIPSILLVGWRGRPGVHDEPQHVKQGEITMELLNVLGIESHVLEADGTLEGLREVFDERLAPALAKGRTVALVVAKGAFGKYAGQKYMSDSSMSREQAIQAIAGLLGEDSFVVSTTGKASRELYEYRANSSAVRGHDFLTVGSMGHAAMIALGIAEQKADKRVCCLDGDGAVLMHMGGMALIGSRKPKNFLHVLLNNCAHESVGGMPTVAGQIDFPAVARACGYSEALCVSDAEALVGAVERCKAAEGPVFLQVNVNLDSRADLGRPKTTPAENKAEFMRELAK